MTKVETTPATAIHKEMVKGIEDSAIRLDSDIYGNPAYYCAVYLFAREDGSWFRPFNANKYRGKRYGAGWRFQSYNIRRTIERAIEEEFNVKFGD